MARPNQVRCRLSEDEIAKRKAMAADPLWTLEAAAMELGIAFTGLSHWCRRNGVKWVSASNRWRGA